MCLHVYSCAKNSYSAAFFSLKICKNSAVFQEREIVCSAANFMCIAIRLKPFRKPLQNFAAVHGFLINHYTSFLEAICCGKKGRRTPHFEKKTSPTITMETLRGKNYSIYVLTQSTTGEAPYVGMADLGVGYNVDRCVCAKLLAKIVLQRLFFSFKFV